ncbi:MAG: membrane protein FxsA [Gemmatimonadetes bacterium]|nr:membrane protein FxsA [Gemmatimonadota bacterium]MYG22060.1 membrane protein FxsA [Gemmatimonadota bacterium]MYJ37311.1 membrane protein FxsA [Gemmatimonadota bacterium]
MLSRLILLFVTVPLVELAILLQVAQWIGLLPTVALVVTTGIAGAALARNQGLRAFLSVQDELAEGRLPGRSLLDGLSILVGGAFLLTPGILTDIAGFSLLVPFSRRMLQRALRRTLERRVREGTVEFRVFTPGGGSSTRRGDVGTREVGTHPPRYRDRE